MITHPLILKLKNCSCWETKTKIWMYNLSSFSLYPLFILNNLFCLFIFLWFFSFFIFLSILMVIISLELTRVNRDRNIFSINVELTSTFLLYRGLVHHHHRILNQVIIDQTTVSRVLMWFEHVTQSMVGQLKLRLGLNQWEISKCDIWIFKILRV